MIRYNEFVQKHGSNLTKKEFDYLTQFETKPSNFYGLPKIHKSKEINEACSISKENYIEIDAPENHSFRPTVTGPTCETHRLSNFIDILLQPFSKRVKSYIKDSTDFLTNFSESTDPKATPVTFDVESLYTNIPHTLGPGAINFWLQKHPEYTCISSRINKKKSF